MLPKVATGTDGNWKTEKSHKNPGRDCGGVDLVVCAHLVRAGSPGCRCAIAAAERDTGGERHRYCSVAVIDHRKPGAADSRLPPPRTGCSSQGAHGHVAGCPNGGAPVGGVYVLAPIYQPRHRQLV